MTPRPRKATFAIVFLLECRGSTPIWRSDCDGAALASTRDRVDRVGAALMVSPKLGAKLAPKPGGPMGNDAMAVTKEQVVGSLKAFAAPPGIPLPAPPTPSAG